MDLSCRPESILIEWFAVSHSGNDSIFYVLTSHGRMLYSLGTNVELSPLDSNYPPRQLNLTADNVDLIRDIGTLLLRCESIYTDMSAEINTVLRLANALSAPDALNALQ